MIPPTFLVTWGIAARPFLPAGRGGLILIAGGLTMISLALLVLNARHRPIPGSVSLEPPRRRIAAASEVHIAAPAKSQKDTARRSAAKPAQFTPVVVHRPQPTASPGHKAPPPAPAQPLARAVTISADGERMVWPSYIQANVAKHGLHSRVVSVDRTRCLIEVQQCRSCRKQKSACERERRQLQQAARKLNRRAQVAEAACNREGRHVCTFRVDMGGRK